jgi:hypothetical protein
MGPRFIGVALYQQIVGYSYQWRVWMAAFPGPVEIPV